MSWRAAAAVLLLVVLLSMSLRATVDLLVAQGLIKRGKTLEGVAKADAALLAAPRWMKYTRNSAEGLLEKVARDPQESAAWYARLFLKTHRSPRDGVKRKWLSLLTMGLAACWICLAWKALGEKPDRKSWLLMAAAWLAWAVLLLFV